MYKGKLAATGLHNPSNSVNGLISSKSYHSGVEKVNPKEMQLIIAACPSRSNVTENQSLGVESQGPRPPSFNLKVKKVKVKVNRILGQSQSQRDSRPFLAFVDFSMADQEETTDASITGSVITGTVILVGLTVGFSFLRRRYKSFYMPNCYLE